MLIHIIISSFGLTFYFVAGHCHLQNSSSRPHNHLKKFSCRFGFVFSYIYSYHIAVLNHIGLVGHWLVASQHLPLCPFLFILYGHTDKELVDCLSNQAIQYYSLPNLTYPDVIRAKANIRNSDKKKLNIYLTSSCLEIMPYSATHSCNFTVTTVSDSGGKVQVSWVKGYICEKEHLHVGVFIQVPFS